MTEPRGEVLTSTCAVCGQEKMNGLFQPCSLRRSERNRLCIKCAQEKNKKVWYRHCANVPPSGERFELGTDALRTRDELLSVVPIWRRRPRDGAA